MLSRPLLYLILPSKESWIEIPYRMQVSFLFVMLEITDGIPWFVTWKEAEQSLRLYRNLSSTATGDKAFEHELVKLKGIHAYSQRKQTPAKPAIGLNQFMCRSFAIGCVLMWAHEFCGTFVMCNYAGMIFAKSGSSMSPTVSSMIVGAIQFVGSYVSTLLVDRSGRKVHIPQTWQNPLGTQQITVFYFLSYSYLCNRLLRIYTWNIVPYGHIVCRYWPQSHRFGHVHLSERWDQHRSKCLSVGASYITLCNDCRRIVWCSTHTICHSQRSITRKRKHLSYKLSLYTVEICKH